MHSEFPPPCVSLQAKSRVSLLSWGCNVFGSPLCCLCLIWSVGPCCLVFSVFELLPSALAFLLFCLDSGRLIEPSLLPLVVQGSSRGRLAVRAHVPKPDWHAPWELMRVLSGHQGWVRSIAVEPGNKWFATGASDRTIKIWDLASGTLRLTLTGHINCIRGLAVSPRHPYMFSAGEDKMVMCKWRGVARYPVRLANEFLNLV